MATDPKAYQNAVRYMARSSSRPILMRRVYARGLES